MSKPARTWVKLWKEERGPFAQLPFITRAVAAELLKFLDDNGRLYIGNKSPADALAFCAGATQGDRRAMRVAVDQLLEVGYLSVVNGWLEAPSYRSRQYEFDASQARVQHELATSSSRACNELSTSLQRAQHENTAKYSKTHGSHKSYGELAPPLEKRREEERRREEKEDREVCPADAGDPPQPETAPGRPEPAERPEHQVAPQTSILGLVSPSQRAPAKSSPTPDVLEVFEYWKTVMGSPRSLLDSHREKAINKALKNYSIADCKLAIDGCAATDWNMGRDPRSSKKYNGIDLIFRNSEYIERFIGTASPAATKANANEDPPDYDPARHGKPKSIANFAKWNAHLYGDQT